MKIDDGSFLYEVLPVEGCPPGLEHLLETEHIIVKQQVEAMEGMHIKNTSNAVQC